MENKAKKAIRKELLKKRSQLDKERVTEYSEQICEKLINSNVFEQAEEIYCYMDYKNEVATKSIFVKAWQKGKKVAIPYVRNKEEIRFVYVDSFDDVSEGAFGILEPKNRVIKEARTNNQLVIMPLLAFDSKCNRLGYGGGYYDRFLKVYPEVTTAALAFSMQEVPSIPNNDFDIQPSMIITEKRIYRK